jgi:hypothetical protein
MTYPSMFLHTVGDRAMAIPVARVELEAAFGTRAKQIVEIAR